MGKASRAAEIPEAEKSRYGTVNEQPRQFIWRGVFEEGGNLLTLTPINLKTANAFVQQYHRHHKPTRGHKFSIGVSENGALVGVAICGRPVARRLGLDGRGRRKPRSRGGRRRHLQGKLPKRRSLLQRPRTDQHHPARVHPGLVPEERGEGLLPGPGALHRLRSDAGRLPGKQPEGLREAEQFRGLFSLRLHRDERR